MIRAVTSKWKGIRDLYRWKLPKHLISHLTTVSSKSTEISPHPLLGPPEIYLCTTLSINQWQVGSSTQSTNQWQVGSSAESFHESSSFCNTKLPLEPPPNGFIKVGSSLLPSMGNPCLDFFIYVCPNRKPFYLEHYLEMAWNHNPLTTLKIICFWRDARQSTGKPRRESFYRIALWIHRNHPKTLANNLEAFARYGYLKDLLEILYRVMKGSNLVREIPEEYVTKRMKKKMKTEGRPSHPRIRCENNSAAVNYNTEGQTVEKNLIRIEDLMEILYRVVKGSNLVREIPEEYVTKRMKKKKKTEGRPSHPRMLNFNLRCENNSAAVNYNTEGQTVEKNLIVQKENPINMKRRRKRTILMAKEAVEKYKNDLNYQFLHNLVADIFAKLLKSDMELLKCGEISKISLAAKWCPSLGSSYDRSTLICESISRRIFPLDLDPEYKEIGQEAHYAYRVRDRLRKQVLVPLREALNLPENLKIPGTELNRIQEAGTFSRVGYVTLLNYKKLWRKKNGHPPISRAWDKLVEGRVFQYPHNLISLYYSSLGGGALEDYGKRADQQWCEMVEGHIKKGKFGSCLAVCFQGSNCLQMHIIASLGLLVSDVTEEPWRKYILVCNPEPELEKFDMSELFFFYECNLWERYGYLKTSLAKRTGDFCKIADVILQFAIQNKLSQDKMIKRLFVFCDSYFGEAFGYDDLVWGGDSWERDYEIMRNKYKDKGYILPELVFWKISSSRHYPMLSMKKGVTILNGHSKILMTYFLEEGGRVGPEDLMRWAISGEEYKHLVVLD